MNHVSDPDAAMQLTALKPVGPGYRTDETGADDTLLAALYEYPGTLSRPWVRANMITSLDGGATDDGTSGGLAGPGDRTLFGLMRQMADVILVGAATARIENYGGAQLSAAQRQARQARGQSEVPPIAVVTHAADFAHDARLFTHTEVPPLLLTSRECRAEVTRRFGSVAEVIDASGSEIDRVDPHAVLRIFGERGLLRVLTEGGPSLLSLLIEEDLLDELCMTIAPIVVGGSARRIASGMGQAHTRMRRSQVLTDDEGYLYTRYVRA